jgi:RNA recognition motif-containing protein
MTRQQMLDKMRITDEDFRDYLRKHSVFLNSLEPRQREFHHHHVGKMTVEELAKAFGPDVTAKDIESLFAECPPVHGILFARCC